MDEELNRSESQETGTQEPEQKKTKMRRTLEMDNRRMIIFTVAGAYLLYLAFKILTGISAGAEGTVLVTHVIPIAASVLFIAAGGWLLYHCVRAFLAQQKEPDEKETTEEEK